MNKIAQRFLIFFLGVPAVAALVLLLPHYNHLALNVAIVVSSALGAMEFSAMLAQKNLKIPKAEAAVIGALLPAATAALVTLEGISFSPDIFLFALTLGVVMPTILTLGVGWMLLSRVFSSGERLDGFAGRVVAGLAVLLYPGVFMMWIVGMTLLHNAGIVIIVFLLMVFGGDSLAWATGMLFGRNNRGVVPASPNKSVAGFIGGVLGPVIVMVGAVHFRPDVFAFTDIPIIAGIVTGLLTGCAAILGDLAESALKRSSGIKDSGSFIIGRGGVLDSIDSVAMAAPVFFLCYIVFFTQFL